MYVTCDARFKADGRHLSLMLIQDPFQPFDDDARVSLSPFMCVCLNLRPANRFRLGLGAHMLGIFPGKAQMSSRGGAGVAHDPHPAMLALIRDEVNWLNGPGIRVYDAYTRNHFTLHAKLIMVLSDLKGHEDFLDYPSGLQCLKCNKAPGTKLMNNGKSPWHNHWPMLPLAHPLRPLCCPLHNRTKRPRDPALQSRLRYRTQQEAATRVGNLPQQPAADDDEHPTPFPRECRLGAAVHALRHADRLALQAVGRARGACLLILSADVWPSPAPIQAAQQCARLAAGVLVAHSTTHFPMLPMFIPPRPAQHSCQALARLGRGRHLRRPQRQDTATPALVAETTRLQLCVASTSVTWWSSIPCTPLEAWPKTWWTCCCTTRTSCRSTCRIMRGRSTTGTLGRRIGRVSQAPRLQPLPASCRAPGYWGPRGAEVAGACCVLASAFAGSCVLPLLKRCHAAHPALQGINDKHAFYDFLGWLIKRIPSAWGGSRLERLGCASKKPRTHHFFVLASECQSSRHAGCIVISLSPHRSVLCKT